MSDKKTQPSEQALIDLDKLEAILKDALMWVAGATCEQRIKSALSLIRSARQAAPEAPASRHEAIAGAVARGWCTPENASKVLDSDLALAIVAEVEAELARRCCAQRGNKEGNDNSAVTVDAQADTQQARAADEIPAHYRKVMAMPDGPDVVGSPSKVCRVCSSFVGTLHALNCTHGTSTVTERDCRSTPAATTVSASIDANGAFTFPVDDRAPAQQTERMQPSWEAVSRVGSCVAVGSDRIIIATAISAEWADKIVAAMSSATDIGVCRSLDGPASYT